MRVYFAATFVLIALSGAFAQTQIGGSISGIVTNRVTGEPVRKAEVTVLDKDDASGTAITDSNGHFVFSGLPPGEYRVRVSREGFEQAAYGGRGPNRPGKIITLSAGEARSDIAIGIEALSAISGVVLDAEGDPLTGAQVMLFHTVFQRGKPRLVSRNSTQTDERGEYRIFGLAPGRYYVMAKHESGGPMFVAGGVGGLGQSSAGVLAKQFFPGADDRTAAQPVTVVPGKELRGVDFHLQMRQPAHLRGRLVAPDGAAKGQWDVQIVVPDLPDWANFASGGQLPEDTFEDVLPPGKYVLVATLTSGSKQYRGVQTVDLTAGGEQQVTIQLQPAVDLAGVVQFDGPPVGKHVQFRVNLSPGDDASRFSRSPSAIVKPDLHFVLSNVTPGVWDIGMNPLPSGYYLKAMSLGDQDVMVEDMTIGPKTAAPLKIVIGTQPAKLEGEIEGDVLKDGARATILLRPTGKYSGIVAFFRAKITEPNGHFTMEGLAPGKYNVYAFEDLDPDQRQNPELLKPLAKWAAAVELREGETASVKPKLIRAAEIEVRPE